MSAGRFTIRGGGVGCGVPCTVDGSGKITGVGATNAFDSLVDTGVTLVIDGSASKQEFIQILLDHGYTWQVPKLTTVLEGATATPAATGSSGTGDQMSMTIVECDDVFMNLVSSNRSVPWLVGLSMGEFVTGGVSKFCFLLGKISSNVDRKTKGEEVVTTQLQFTGQSFSASAAGDTALALTMPAITPLGGAEVTFPAISAGDVTTLKSGILVFK